MKNFKELQNIHRELMAQYVDILNRASMLPFFVDIFSMRQIKQDKSRQKSFWFNLYKIILYPFQFIVIFLTWRPLVRLFIEDHLHSKLKEISSSYIRLIQTVDSDKKSDFNKIEWLKKSSENCDAFASTIFSWTSLKGSLIWLSNIIIGLILAYVGFDNIFQLAVKFNWSQSIVSLFLSIASLLIILTTYGFLIFAVAIVSFYAKRVLLFPNADLRPSSKYTILPAANIYKIENDLFVIIGRKKSAEFPVDIFITLIVTCIFPIFFFLITYIFVISNSPVTANGGIVLSFLFFASIPIFAGFQHIQDWKKREWR